MESASWEGASLLSAHQRWGDLVTLSSKLIQINTHACTQVQFNYEEMKKYNVKEKPELHCSQNGKSRFYLGILQ